MRIARRSSKSRAARDARAALGVLGVDPALERRERDRAVHRAGVEEGEAERLGDLARERALARGRGSVDGDDHRRSRPRRREGSGF